jgi:hypothetical protein
MSTSEQKDFMNNKYSQQLFDDTLETFQASKQGAADVAKMLHQLQSGGFINATSLLENDTSVVSIFHVSGRNPKWKQTLLNLLETLKDTLQVRQRKHNIDVQTREVKNAPDDWTGFIEI